MSGGSGKKSTTGNSGIQPKAGQVAAANTMKMSNASPGQASAATDSSGSFLLRWLHLGLTGLLAALVGGIGILAATGLVRFGGAESKPVDQPGRVESKEKDSPGGRYQIEKDDAKEAFDRAIGHGMLGQGLDIHELWVFRYQGGYVQVHLETDFEGQATSTAPLPQDLKPLLARDDAIAKGLPGATLKQGHIFLVAVRPTFTPEYALQPYMRQLGGVLGNSAYGPLGVLPPMHVEVEHRRMYRLFLTVNPMPGKQGPSFNIPEAQVILMSAPLVARNPAEEEVYLGGGKDLSANKEILLLDRQRGYSRLRLKAMFLGDSKVEQLAREGTSPDGN